MGNLNYLNSRSLLKQERELIFNDFSISDGINLGEIGKSIAIRRGLSIALQVRINEMLIYHVALPGTSTENLNWLERKSRVVLLKHHSTLYESIYAKEREVDWYTENNLTEKTHAIHGGGIHINTKAVGYVGMLLISGLPQVEDHQLGIEIMTNYRTGKVN